MINFLGVLKLGYMSKSSFLVLVVVALVVFYGGYWLGNKKGYDNGLTDAAKIQSGAQPEVKVDTGYKNPYEGVNLNPFK